MDYVPNHSSDEHEWFVKSVQREDPYTDYYVWEDSLGVDGDGNQIPPNNWVPFGTGRHYKSFPLKQPLLKCRLVFSASPPGNSMKIVANSTSTSL